MKKVFAWVFILALLTQAALGEVVNVDRTALYQSEKKFSMSGDAKVMQMAFAKTLGRLTVEAKVLDKSTYYNTTQELIVQTGTSVSFSYDNISSKFAGKESQWKIISDGTRKIDSLDFGNKIGMGGILVQKSHDGSKWETVCQKCNVFKDYPYSVRNFYTASRSDLNDGCYYRVTIAYRTQYKSKKNHWYEIPKKEKRRHVETYKIYILADDYTENNKSNGNESEIQSKYYDSPNKTINAYFRNDTFSYTTKNNLPMSIEVPTDQYDQCVELMRRRIANGKVPGVTNPNEATNYIKKSIVTYRQAVSLAETKLIDGLKYDAITKIVSSTSSFGISSIIEYALSIWGNCPEEDALENLILRNIDDKGDSFGIAVDTVFDAIDLFKGRISVKQMMKNAFVNTAAKVGEEIGESAGGALGGIIPIPGSRFVLGIAGGAVGQWVGHQTGNILSNFIIKDDKVEMQNILETEFASLKEEYFINYEEAVKIANALSNKLENNADILKEMVASKDKYQFAHELLAPMVWSVIKTRKRIVLPDAKAIGDSLLKLSNTYTESQKAA